VIKKTNLLIALKNIVDKPITPLVFGNPAFLLMDQPLSFTPLALQC
jgi:hypothetical protein